VLISVEGKGENQSEPSQENMGSLQCRHTVLCFKKKTWPNRAVWRSDQLWILHFSGCFLLTASLRRRTMSMYTSLFTVAIPVNYTSEFREPFEATMYIRKKASWYVVRNYAASIGNFLPTFRDKLLVPSSGENNSKERSRFLAQKIMLIGCTEKSVRNDQYLMCNYPKESSSHITVI